MFSVSLAPAVYLTADHIYMNGVLFGHNSGTLLALPPAADRPTRPCANVASCLLWPCSPLCSCAMARLHQRYVVSCHAAESGGMKIFSGNANTALAKDIAAYLGINLGRVKVRGGEVNGQS